MAGPLRGGPAQALRVEEGFLYVNEPGHGGRVFAQSGGIWLEAGEHDVDEWVDRVEEDGAFAFWRRPGRLVVGTRQ